MKKAPNEDLVRKFLNRITSLSQEDLFSLTQTSFSSEFVISYGLLALLFIIDFFLSLGIASGLLYVICLVAAIWLLNPRNIMNFGIACTAAALVGFFTPIIEVQNNGAGLLARISTILVVVAVYILRRRHSDLETKYRETHERLNSALDTRTQGIKQITGQLNEVKRRLTEAEEIGHTGFWEFHPPRARMVWSKGVFTIYDHPVSSKAPSIQEFVDRTYEEDVDALRQSIETTLMEKKPSSLVYRLNMPDGSLKWIHYKGRPLIDRHGKVETLIGTIQDITLLKRSDENIEIIKKKYNSFFENTAIPKALFLPDKRILEVNSAFSQWTGYNQHELLEIPIDKLIHKEDQFTSDFSARKILQNGFYQKEKRFVRKDGHIVRGLFCASAVVDSSENVMFFSVEILDLSSLKEAEAAQKNAENALHEAKKRLIELEPEHSRAFNEPLALDPSDTRTHNGNLLELERAYGIAEEVVNHLFDLAEDNMAIIGKDGLYKRISQSLSHRLEIARYVLEEQPVIDYIHPRERATFNEYLNLLFSGQPLQQVPLRHRCADGSYCTFSLDATFNREHEVAYVALRSLDPAVKSSNAVFHERDTLTGSDAGEEYFIPMEYDEDAIFSEPPDHENDEIDVSIFAAPAEQRKPDIAKDPSAVPEIQQTQSRFMWRNLSEKLPLMVWMLDEDLQCIYANQKFQDFTGLPFDQLSGEGWSKTLHPGDYRNYAAYCAAHIKKRKPLSYTYRMQRADGTYRWMQETSIPKFNEQDQLEGYLSTCLDISNLKKVTGLFARALEGALNLEDIHSSIVTCLNNESQYIITENVKIADALLHNAREMPQRDLAALMHFAGQRMLGFINDMLAFSKIKPQNYELLKRSISLRKIVSTTVEMLTPLQLERGPRFQIDEESENLYVKGDKVMLHRIFETLMRGLFESAESSVIIIDFATGRNYNTVSFSHLGPILTDSFLKELSDLYRENVQLSSYQENSGIHLAMIKRLIEIMGGSLQVIDQQDVGPVLRIRLRFAEEEESEEDQSELPFEDSHEEGIAKGLSLEWPHFSEMNHGQIEDQPPFPSYNNGIPAEHHSSRQRVLIGEQNKDMQRLVRSLLQPHYDLTIVQDTDALLKQVDEAKFDLLMLDIHLQGQGGHTGVGVLKELRRKPDYHKTPIIAVASDSSEANKKELLEKGGFDGFIPKPFSIVELLETLETMINS